MKKWRSRVVRSSAVKAKVKSSKPTTTDAELLQSALKKLTQEELRVVFEVGALLHDPMSRELLRKLVE